LGCFSCFLHNLNFRALLPAAAGVLMKNKIDAFWVIVRDQPGATDGVNERLAAAGHVVSVEEPG
jgi:hypothetical protein